jgi:hypothetical protein
VESETHSFTEISVKALRMIQQYQFSGPENLFPALVREEVDPDHWRTAQSHSLYLPFVRIRN